MEARAPTWETTTLNVSVPQALEETFVKKVTTLYIHCLLVLSGVFVFPIPGKRIALETGDICEEGNNPNANSIFVILLSNTKS